jgi:L-rhamnose-H+ transport protein
MTPNPFLGLLFHWLGGFAAASFYVPYRNIKHWPWEIFWLTGGVFAWVVAPWLFAFIQTSDLIGVLNQVPRSTLLWCIMFGALWGVGGLTYGLTMRYLGLSLGMAVVLGLSTVFGTLIPPIYNGEFYQTLIATAAGNMVLLGLLVTVIGIVIVALAGASKDSSLDTEKKSQTIAEFDFRKGTIAAIFSGIMSSCFAYGLAAGEPIKAISAMAGTGPLWTGLPVLCLIMFGGLVTNAIWCGVLIIKNRSAGYWIGRDRFAGSMAVAGGANLPIFRNFILCAIAGFAWYFQFFFYTMGESHMGKFGFSSWTLHMASIIIFGTLWGFAFNEWKDAAPRTRRLVWTGVGVLVFATVIIGSGNALTSDVPR